jgi:flagellar assembly factor FliW
MAENGTERVVETRLGTKTVGPERVIRFPRGLIGFEEEREFVLLRIRDDSPFLVLQSMNDPGLGLLVADPFPFLPGYELKIGEAERKLLQLEAGAEPAVLVSVSIPPGQPDRTALNLTGPIAVNSEARIGLQIPQVDGTYGSQVLLGELGGK